MNWDPDTRSAREVTCEECSQKWVYREWTDKNGKQMSKWIAVEERTDDFFDDGAIIGRGRGRRDPW
jgi:hypothetical protein